VRLTDQGYEVTDLVHGDTVTEVLNYVQFHASDLLATFRRKVSAAKDLTRQEANSFIADYVAGLEGYTYLEGDGVRGLGGAHVREGAQALVRRRAPPQRGPVICHDCASSRLCAFAPRSPCPRTSPSAGSPRSDRPVS
jgi:hypothetical protein